MNKHFTNANASLSSDSNSAKITVALCGNPNSGKTTLFNRLTGSNQKVGNWPGVTVEQKLGVCKSNPNCAVVDTPGIYSLSPFTVDEQVAHNYLMTGKPDLIVNVVDSTCLERSLFLTSQLLDLDVPVVVALNMQDEARAKGIIVNVALLEKQFGCKFFAISAAKNQGIAELLHYCTTTSFGRNLHTKFSELVENAIGELTAVLPLAANKRWVALKLLEEDATVKSMCLLSNEHTAFAREIHDKLEVALGDDVSAKIAEERFNTVSQMAKSAQSITAQTPKEIRAQSVTRQIDRIVLNKWLAFPVFAAVMTLVFYLSVSGVGGFLTSLINEGLTPWLQEVVGNWLNKLNTEWLRSLVCDGIISGVMGVVGFLPQIMLLFGFIAILEASGYMSRIAFITDRLLNKIGLGGRSFVSMILGCGCSVPAIMATRTIKNPAERNATITLVPFMPCSAKLAVISFFTSYMLKGNALFAISFYFLSIFAVVLGGLVLKAFSGGKKYVQDTFIMELPSYRAPTVKNVMKQMWERGKAFLAKAGTIIFAASVLLWLLQNFNWKFETADRENSMLASIGKLIAPLFYPLGFNDRGCGWQFAISALTGIAAKETVITTLQILLPQGVENSISGLGAYCFVLYNLLTVPCVAAISASFAEQGNWKRGLASAAFQIATAYFVTLVIYQIGTLAHMYTRALVVALIAATIATVTFLVVKRIASDKAFCRDCAACHRRDSCKANHPSKRSTKK